jgi:histidinol-phosphate/aromatic aminotransferase/cobyric acid decarboxylase-like protein
MEDNGREWIGIFPQRDGPGAALRLGYIASQAAQFQDALDELRGSYRPGSDTAAFLDQAATAARELAESATLAARIVPRFG